jgi:hypothetical protein
MSKQQQQEQFETGELSNAGDQGAEQTGARNANRPNLPPPSSTHHAAIKTSANQYK